MDPTVIARLQEIVGPAYVHTSPQALLCYSYDATFHAGRPEAVVLPASTEQVAAIMRLASERRIPVTPRGAGTGLSGGSLPRGGIALALTRMNRILTIDEANLLAVVEPGVVTGRLQAEVEKRGLFYPPDPASGRVSTIGGNIAENAGGPRCFKYGVTRDYVLGLEVVLPDGTVIQTGGQTVKNVTGFDLTRLIVGSEGTLGIVTRATLRLIPQPEAVRTLLAVFPKLDDAARTTAAIVKRGITPATLEFMDQLTLQVVENYLHVGLPVEAEAVLLIEVDGFTEAVERQAAIIEAVCRETGASQVRQARTEAERAELWVARKSISTAITQVKPAKIGEDITVPVAQIPEMIRRLHYLKEKYGLTMAIFGHAGDGNLHPNIVTDLREEGEMEKVEEAMAEIARIAVGLGGTLSGEHGIGTLKAPYLEMEVGADVLALMRRIKRAFDPLNILNPGKMRLDEQ
ncbi:MAG: FAD-binding oxidoreductase [Bacillota bacterium]